MLMYTVTNGKKLKLKKTEKTEKTEIGYVEKVSSKSTRATTREVLKKTNSWKAGKSWKKLSRNAVLNNQKKHRSGRLEYISKSCQRLSLPSQRL